MLNRLLRLEAGFFLGIWLFLMVGGRSRLFRDPGTFWTAERDAGFSRQASSSTPIHCRSRNI